MRVLIADDKAILLESMTRALSLEGYEVESARNGLEALKAIEVSNPELVILDVHMPELDGLEVCRQLRKEGNKVPILLLTVRDGISDRVAGLDAGADDYLVKPFELGELMARTRALVRRAHAELDRSPTRFGPLRLDPPNRRAWIDDRPLNLTRTEFKLLTLLVAHPHQVVTRETAMEHIWGFDPGPTSNTVAVYVGYLRNKLEEQGAPRLIHTVRGVGYVLRAP